MRPRDEQDYEERRQQIIDGALKVFASKGFETATNKEIAAAAGIGSPGLIYHYFKDKQDLFQQVLENRLPLLQLLNQGEEEMMHKPPRHVLTIFGKAMLRVTEDPTSLAMMRLVFGEAYRRPIVAEMINTMGPRRSFGFLTRYLARQMAKGNLRSMDVGAAACCFVGAMIAYVHTREVFPQPDSQKLDPDTLVTTAVEIFLKGMEPVADGDKLAT